MTPLQSRIEELKKLAGEHKALSGVLQRQNLAAESIDVLALIKALEIAVEYIEARAEGWPGSVGSHQEHLERFSAEARAKPAREALARMTALFTNPPEEKK